MSEADVNSLFLELGLTEYESKTLSTILKLKEAEAPDISRLAQVPKTRVYDVLDKLIRRGLIIEISGRPKKYRGIDPSESVNLLLNEKKAGLKALESKANGVKQLFLSAGQGIATAEEKVLKVKDKSDFERILAQELESAESSVVGFTALESESSVLANALEKAKNKNVTIRLVNHAPTDAIKKHARDIGLNVRHSNHGLTAFVVDDKKVVLALSDTEKSPEYHFAIWSDNKAMASMLQGYFDKHWDAGKPI
ncbi:MAG: TrmB family transcriptional regulator [Candidatus Diapherotrites archaeon]|nr:TrmB family transcriptional regulator [Candidatus Diapherotrites archaeon]